MRPLKCEAPPDSGGASRNISQRAAAKIDNSECSCVLDSRQGPRHIGEIANKVFLDNCEHLILHQLEKLAEKSERTSLARWAAEAARRPASDRDGSPLFPFAPSRIGSLALRPCAS